MHHSSPHDASHHPTLVLVESRDPRHRRDAHLNLGRRALEREDHEAARRHFDAAADLDPDDERVQAALRDLPQRRRTGRSLFSYLLRR